MKWKYRTYIKWKSKDKELLYNVDESTRLAIYKFNGYIREININPLTAYDDILIDIADNFTEKWR